MKFSLIACHPLLRRWLPAAAAVPLIGFAAGCASPGPPQPPSLNLPEVVKDLTAERVGDVVHLHWTTPEMTTDRINVQGAMTAEICRITVGTPAPQASACSPVKRLPVQPGPTQADETLPPPLTADPPALLAYRVQLFNVHGRSAGLSPEAFVSSGVAPPTVEQLRATDTRDGAMLEWQQRGHPGRCGARPAGRWSEWRCYRAATAQNKVEIVLQIHDQKAAGEPSDTRSRLPAEAASTEASDAHRGETADAGPTGGLRWNDRPYCTKGRDLPLHGPTGSLGIAWRPCPGASQLHLAAGYGCDAGHLSAACSVRP